MADILLTVVIIITKCPMSSSSLYFLYSQIMSFIVGIPAYSIRIVKQGQEMLIYWEHLYYIVTFDEMEYFNSFTSAIIDVRNEWYRLLPSTVRVLFHVLQLMVINRIVSKYGRQWLIASSPSCQHYWMTSIILFHFLYSTTISCYECDIMCGWVFQQKHSIVT